MLKLSTYETITDIRAFIETNKASFLAMKKKNKQLAEPYKRRLERLKKVLLLPGNEKLAKKYLPKR